MTVPTSESVSSRYSSRKFLVSLIAAALFVAGEIMGADFSRAAYVLLAYVGVEGAADFKER